MTRHLRRMAGAAALALLVPGSARAQPMAGVEWMRADWLAIERLDDGQEFNRDAGAVDDRRAWIEWPLAGTWRVRVEAARATAGLLYTGRTSIGLPLVSSTGWRHEQAEALLVRSGPSPAGLGWQVGLGLGAGSATRSIAATDLSRALTERLQRAEALAELGFRLPLPGTGFGLAWRGHARVPLAQRLDVSSPGGLDALRLKPDGGSTWRTRLGVHAAFTVAGRVPVELALSHQRERLRTGASDSQTGRLNGRPIGSVRYPGSKTHVRGTVLTLAVGF